MHRRRAPSSAVVMYSARALFWDERSAHRENISYWGRLCRVIIENISSSQTGHLRYSYTCQRHLLTSLYIKGTSKFMMQRPECSRPFKRDFEIHTSNLYRIPYFKCSTPQIRFRYFGYAYHTQHILHTYNQNYLKRYTTTPLIIDWRVVESHETFPTFRLGKITIIVSFFITVSCI